jgi:conjugal transfer pilus assembly protein TrbC
MRMTNNRFRLFHAVVAALVFLPPGITLAQEHLFGENLKSGGQAMRLPLDQEILDAHSRSRGAMQQLEELEELEELDHNDRITGQDIPEMNALPRSAAPAEDISLIADKFKAINGPRTETMRSLDLLVLVSLSIPEGALRKLAEQAERAGATLVFRGLKEDSMAKMGEAIRKILAGRNVHVAIHPPAFQQFSVTQVPAFVLASQDAGRVLDNGCARPQTFIKVSGDVTLDYALDYIERKGAGWATAARSFRSRIIRTDP